MTRRGLFIFLLFQIYYPIQSRADVVYPARLEMKEVEPEVFSVRFNLPMINNRRLRAEPVLPAACRDLMEREVRVSPNDYVEIRRVGCSPDPLFGKNIAVKGLIGTQVDVILFLDMLDGRSYTATLKPAKAVFTIPRPPSLLELGTSSGSSGMRRILSRPELFLLLFLLVFLEIRGRTVLPLGCGFIVGCAVGQYLFDNKWLLLSPYLSIFAVLIAVLMPSLNLLEKKANSPAWIRPMPLFGFLFGLLRGGSPFPSFRPDGLSSMEDSLAFLFHHGGITLGLLLAYGLTVEFRQILRLIPVAVSAEKRDRVVAFSAGILAVASILLHFGTLLTLPSIIPGAPAEFFLLILALGVWMGLSEAPYQKPCLLLLPVPLLAGIFLGHFKVHLPLGPLFVSGTLFLIGVSILSGRFGRHRIVLSISAIALLYHGWNSAMFIEENLSLPIAVSTGAAVVGVLIFLMVRNTAATRQWIRGAPIVRASGAGVILAAVIFRLVDYSEWFENTVAGEMAMGFIRIPVVAIVLLAAAVFAWPRRRRIQNILNVEVRKPVLHWALLFLSFFMLPYGTPRAKNVFHDPSAPAGDSARRILTRVLTNTYHAFNLEDEEKLYDRLSKTVSGDLIEDVYLDSRRKLTSGVRQGAEVTVRDVNVVWVGEEIDGSNAVEGYTYECKWSITARVRHLQHVHHRQNIYTGLLRVQVIDNEWKIGRIALISEDRVIIPWGSG